MPLFIFLVMLWLCANVGQCTTANVSKLFEHTAEHLTEKMHSGKTFFVYFGHQVSPTLVLFLDQLEMSAEVLEDYGISVAKVNCSKEHVAKYCTGDKIMKKAYLFRGTELLKSFDTDTVFDVHAIVSHVLFTVLFDEVRYVHTVAELLAVERAAKGRLDVVLGHVQVLGLPEHRALMETAFVYGAKYQFVLTTGGPVLEHMGVKEPASLAAGLWFLHCKGLTRLMEPCPHTALTRALTTLHIYAFLQLMEAPLVTESSEDPSQVKVIHSHLQVPLLFLFSQRHTLALDRVTAQTLAWRLRGRVGLVLIHRESPDVKTTPEYNAAYKLTGEGSEVIYLTLNNLEEVIDLFRVDANPDEHDEEEEEEEEQSWTSLDLLDDEVAESVYRNRGQTLDMEAVTELTADTFHSAVADNRHTVVLFYVKWDAVSVAFIPSFLEVAETLEDDEVSDVEMAAVDCGEWTNVCSAQLITFFPTVSLYHPGSPAQPYRGMLGSKSLYTFIMLSRVPSPVLLSSVEEARSFLDAHLHPRRPGLAPARVLGLFSSDADTGVSVFQEASRALRGETLLALLTGRQAETWAAEHEVELPAMLVSRGPQTHPHAHTLHPSTAQDLTSHIQKALLEPFPELTVENLPPYLALGRPLLLLFVGEEEDEQGRRESEGALEEMRALLETGRLAPYLPAWIHLGRTPAGKVVLEDYLGSLPPLPALVLSLLPSGGEVFHYPPDRPIMVQHVLRWLQSAKDGNEPPAGVVGDDKWEPAVQFYDFLSVMDQEVPGYASQRSHKTKTRPREERKKRRNDSGDRQAQAASTGSSKPHQHSEL
ncbi:thioredoxin domain-containing protein 16 isoform X1 [Osmerus eperlanus]|uniref:thioredoxin domain-containing protein 16 isoform X1 n=1 Tax=Osmerus eperlanus TaxID=29151 RepID=UPI002E10C944